MSATYAMTNIRALRNLLSSARYNVAQIDADLARLHPATPDRLYHQGYQNGRKTELESLVATLEVLIAVTEGGAR